MIQVNRIYLIFNRLVTKKFLVDTSVTILIINCFSNLFKGKREVPILVSPPFSGVKLKLANEFFHWMYCCNISIGNRF